MKVDIIKNSALHCLNEVALRATTYSDWIPAQARDDNTTSVNSAAHCFFNACLVRTQ